MIHDIWNPSHREIRAWAYSGEGQPHPHWALTLNDLNNLPLLIELAGDESCPAQAFFINCLYVLTRQVVAKGNFHELARLETALEHLETFEQFEEVREWIRYSRELLAIDAVAELKGWTAEWDSGRSYDRWNREA
ncbi:hypothetical protein [Paenibacillus sp. GCM10027626]|uniref:hypothetical protein n=1 Tax=Paenibacillus sp. GCM10027626 TaxID=3273411 RepID=UPI00363202F1